VLPYIIAGLVTGSAYGMIGVGLVLTYRTSGIFNFAHGALGTLGAYIFYWSYVEQGWPLVVAIILSVGVAGLILGLGLERLGNAMSSRPLAVKIASTVGILLVIQAGTELHWGPNNLNFPKWLPGGSFTVAGSVVTYAQLTSFVIAVAATVLLHVGLQYSRAGKAMRGVVENPDLLDLAGTNPMFYRRLAWTISYGFVALSAILLAPTIGLNPFILTVLVLQGFGAAALGAFRNIPLTFVGGLAIGVLSSLMTKWFVNPGVLQGLAPSLPFIVLFAVTMLLPKRYLATEAIARSRTLQSPWKPPIELVVVGFAAVVIALCFVPDLVGFRLSGWSNALSFVTLFLSLGLVVRSSGQVSLGQITFAAIGVVAFSKFTVDVGIPWLPALALAGLVVVPVGAMLAIPAIRLSGLYFAVCTFGFGYLVQNMFYNTDVMFGLSGTGTPVPAPDLSWLTSDPERGMYYAILAVMVFAAVVVLAVNRTRLGRVLSAMSDSPIGLSASGLSVTVARVLVFCLSGFLAGIGGSMIGVVQEQATVQGFDVSQSLVLLALIMIVLGGAPWYALIAGASLALVPVYIEGETTPTWLSLIFGVSVLAMAVGGVPHLPGGARRLVERLQWRLPRRKLEERRRSREAASPSPSGPAVKPSGALVIEDLTVRFGGLVALDGLSLKAPAGEITGLVGPNGAGKSTTFSACSGLVTPASGKIGIDGTDLSGMSVPARARLGLGRTFQEMQLFDSLSVRETVAMGKEAGFAGGNPVRQVVTLPGERRAVEERAESAIALCGIEDLADQVVGGLSTGQRRLVELARCLAGDFQMLLLDEPSSGLTREETQAMGEILKRVVAERGVGVLLVEHDMSLVMNICKYIYVVDFGELIFQGTPAEVQGSELVRAAYLGDGEGSEQLQEIEERANA
jgi:ABC-type branched-subunit amino acid transport system ATPase component/branched-subunit amino acid ABC-type transport system permease component